jgi:4'-phosphopantetheinyl transferase
VGASPVTFNLSHTLHLAVCAVGPARSQLGVDIERLPENLETALALAKRFFSPQEIDTLRKLGRSEAARLFTTLWTLREAYLKARGIGLGVALDQICFHVGPAGTVHAELGGIGDEAAQWSFRLFSAGQTHVMAVALSTFPGAPTSVRICGGPGGSRPVLAKVLHFGEKFGEKAQSA